MKRAWIMCVVVMGISLAMPSIAGAALHPPDINPANFTGCSVPSNPVFPLVPGTTWMYEGQSEGIPTSDTVQVTCTTKQIILENGVVTATVVHDQAFENGLLVEDTFDYFATDCTGTVWYLGEDSTQIPGGNKEGSWLAGENDADAGFIMLAAPTPGDRYYQEFARGVAEDQAKVLTLSGSASSPYTGPANNLLVTKETSRLDPGVVENKYYKAGIGFIRSDMVKGGEEFTELVSFTLGTGSCGP